MKKPPALNTGDQIDLKPLQNKPIAIKVYNRREVETKFGERPVVNATIYVHGSQEPLQGVLFQSYFAKELEPDEWYCGILAKSEDGGFQRWFLKEAPAKIAAALEKLVPGDEDVPF